MRDFHIGDRVTFFGRAFFVRGLSPMSAQRRSLYLEDAETGAKIEVAADELAAEGAGFAGAREGAATDSE